MPTPIRSKHGRFNGSVGDGRRLVPCPPPPAPTTVPCPPPPEPALLPPLFVGVPPSKPGTDADNTGMTGNKAWMRHEYKPEDLAKAEAAYAFASEFFTRPAVTTMMGITGLREVEGKNENLTYGDLHLTFDDGSDLYVEIKAVQHDISPDRPSERKGDFVRRDGERWPTTIVELCKQTDKTEDWTTEPVGRLGRVLDLNREELAGITVKGARKSKYTGESADYNTFLPDWRLGDIDKAFHNLKPYQNGAIAMFVDLEEKTATFYHGPTLLAVTTLTLRKHGLYDSPGKCDAGSVIVRHVPHPPHAIAVDKNTGTPFPVTPRTYSKANDDKFFPGETVPSCEDWLASWKTRYARPQDTTRTA